MEFADTVKNNMQHLNSEGGIKVEQENVRMVEEEDNDDDDDKKIKFNEEDDVDDKMVEVDDDDDVDDKMVEVDDDDDDDGGDYDEGDTEEEDNANDDDDEGDEEDDDDDDDEVVQEAWAAFTQIEARVALLQEWITADILNGWLWEVELMEKGKLFNIYTTYPSHSS